MRTLRKGAASTATGSRRSGAQLAAVIVEECSERLGATGDESRAFAKIICDLATTISMLPIRFPTMLPTRSAVLAELQANEAAWRRRLTELDGLAEVVVRAQETEIDHELGVCIRRLRYYATW